MYSTFSCQDSEELAAVKSRMEMRMADVNNWMTIDKVKLNTDKTELLVLHPRFRPCNPLTSLTIGKDTIHPSEHARNIGVIFDSTLVKSSFYHLRSIAKIRKYRSYETTKALVVALVMSTIGNYNSLLYGLPTHLVAQLQYVQNAAARAIVRMGKFEHIASILNDLHWLPVVFKISLLIFKFLYNLAPSYLQDLLVV